MVKSQIFKRIAVCLSIITVLSLTSCNHSSSKEVDTSIYRLQFKSKNNFGKNTAKKHKYANAKVVGNSMSVTDKHKTSSVLSFMDSNHNSNYLNLPSNVLNNDSTTIAMWVKMPNTLKDEDSNRPLFGISFSDGYFYVCPYDKETWNSYALHAKFNGAGEETNLTKVEASDDVHGKIAPMSGTLQPIPGAWQLIGFSFSAGELGVYQNGKLMLSYPGNYSLKNTNVSAFKIGSANEATGKDFNGSITDVRIYDKVLTSDDYRNEFDTKYTDFATLKMDFNNSNLNDSVRNYNGSVKEEAKENVRFEVKDGRRVVHLNGEGEKATDARSGFVLPQQALLGHNELTISTNIYVEPRIESHQYLRLFDFSSNDGKRFLAFYYTLYDTNRVRVEVIPNQDEEFKVPWITKPDFWMPIRKWINITLVFASKHIQIIVDGKVVAESKSVLYSPSFLYDYNNCNFYIGRPNNYGDYSLHCYLDDFQMYSVALTDGDIQDLMGHCHTLDDNKAVKNALKNFDIKSCTRPGDGRIYPISHLDDGVVASVTSLDLDVIDEDGYILYKTHPQTCTVSVRLSRNGVSVSQDYRLLIPSHNKLEMALENNDFTKEEYVEDSYQRNMQEETFKWMVSLQNSKLLSSYRVIAGLEDYVYENSYGSWIRPGCGGEGQFQAEYIGALARATNYINSDYVDDIREKLDTLLNAIRECQVAYPNSKYADQNQKGYLNAFTHWCFYGMEHGFCNHVGYNVGPGAIKIEDGFNVPYDVSIWVPFYMYHKQLMMCYDTMTYANMGDPTETKRIKDLAKTMFIEAADWMKREVLKLTEEERESALRVETGGMTEAMYYAYELTGDHDFFKAARFFEESGMIEELYNNSNILSGIHVNTALPKLISCCAAYKVLGDPFYLKAAENVWDMMVDHMTMSNGGISSIAEHYEKPDHATQARFGEETCCSYNMLRLTDYLYRLTGDAKYMRYFEKVFYNHILPSIDMVGSKWSGWDYPYYVDEDHDDSAHTIELDTLQKAGKAYVMSTDFGHHITYSSNEDSFWCCVATGTESYSKLTYGNFYLDKNENVYVNMYNNISLSAPDGKKLTISGIKNGTDKGTEFVEITSNGTTNLNKYRFIKPEWIAANPIMKIGDKKINYFERDGYMIPQGTIDSGSSLTITLPMKLSAVSQRGYVKETSEQGTYSYSLYYGPYMLVPDLGSFPKQSGSDGLDVYIHTGHGSDQAGQHSYQDVGGTVTQLVEFDGTSYNDKISKESEEVEVTSEHAYNSGLRFDFVTTNNGTLTFRPFMDINYERYSFYMYYNVEFRE